MDLQKAYQLEQAVLDAQLKAVRSTISHGGEKGRVLESYVLRFLRDALPSEYGITTGFVAFPPKRAGGTVALSAQLDVIIYDAVHGSPLIRLPTCDVLPLEAVFAYVEVKAKLKGLKGESSVFECVRKAKQIRRHTKRYFHVTTGRLADAVVDVSRVFKPVSTRAYVFAFEGVGDPSKQLSLATKQLRGVAELTGLYVNGVGYFHSKPDHPPEVVSYRKPDSLLAFRMAILHDLARFPRYPGMRIAGKDVRGVIATADIKQYVSKRIRAALV